MLVCIGKDDIAYGIGIFGFRDEECLSQLMDHCTLTKSAKTLKSRQPLPVGNVISMSCEREGKGGRGGGLHSLAVVLVVSVVLFSELLQLLQPQAKTLLCNMEDIVT